ncbi:MAG: hypothetical protein K5924_03155 [Chloroflexi bacterium]|nr:hypothetical protein [Chloroflexota bacterium]
MPARYLFLGLALLLAAVAPVRADTGLTNTVAAAYFPRNADSGLHAIAHERVAEIAACQCLSHDGRRDGTAEVLAWNRGMSDPVSAVVANWQSSSGHHAILSKTTYGRIGCAEAVTGDTHWFACVLATGPLPAAAPPAAKVPQPAPPTGGMLLPDTAMPRGFAEP